MKKKFKQKQVKINIPCILTFGDYHEINYIKNYFNELLSSKKIKAKELGCDGEYSAIFYFTQDEEYKRLVKKYKAENKEDYNAL